MKNVKLRIVYLILGAALLLFALFMLAVNVVIPAHFVSEAEKALRNEAQYENRTIPYTYEGEVYDDDWDDGAEEHFFTPSIVFLELENGYQPNTWSQDTYRLEKKLLAYCSERSVAPNRCHDFKADKHHLIFMPVQEDYGNSEEPYSYIMYIDIGPITRYIVTLNWAFFGVLLAISSVMCLLGFRFGRDIEKEAERQQTFFQNASHELKTPLMAIQGYAEGIQAGVMDTASAAEVILEESDRMTELVEELLDISKIDMGRQQLALSETDIRELLYSPLVFRYLLSLGVDFLSAEELTAETFYRAYINFDKYKGESKIETWLCAIAKNEYRKDRKRREKATATEEMERAADQTDLVDRLLDRDQAISIYKTVHSMAEPYKEVFLLRVLGELSFKEISHIFGKSESWAKVTFFRAKIKVVEKREESI